jgi:hypothetical protein
MKKMMRIMKIKNKKSQSHKKMMNQVEKRHPDMKSQDNNQHQILPPELFKRIILKVR